MADPVTKEQLERMRAALLHAVTERNALRQKLDAQKSELEQPIAIVSMACRLPGGIQNPEDYWRLLDEGRDAIEPFPKERWDAESLYDPDPDAIGKSYSKQGGFLHGIDQFDPEFFGIAPREAQSMDPQQRLVLETAWELLERAGVRPRQLNQSLTGVYIGSLASDYHPPGNDQQALESLDGYGFTGQASSVLSGRLAYTLGLQGPAMTVDTACSSSLVALHLACQALLHRECDLALAGGVTVMVTPLAFVEFSRLRAMAPDGRCKSFSAQADGAGWAEGCGLLLLKRLSDAQRDGDCILALVRGTAVNQDGKSQGLTAPHGPSQERVIRTALQRCALSAADIDLIEAHGTGTQLGDPIEAGALSAVFGPGRSAQQPVHLGSSKSNLGHAQAAAGIAGVIKIVLALGHQKMPQTLHCQPPSPHIDWPHSGLSLLSQGRAWPRGARVRRAGVSSFGVSGTNAHVIVQEAPPPRAYPAAPLQPPCGLWPLQLSARTAAALQAQAAQILEVLGRQPPPELGDLAYSLGTTRTAFAQRAVVVAADGPQAVCGLKALAAAEPVEPGVQGQATVEGKVVFVYPGQGSQWPQMAQELLHSSELFRQQLQLCDEALAPHLSWSVLAVLRGEPGCPSLERVAVVQPVLFSMAVALTALWRSFGVVPQAVVGHSQGEIVAAYVAGALTLQQAARVVALRSQALTQLEGQGAMAAVELSEQQLMPRLERFGDKLSLAAVNGPRSSLVSGRPEAVDELLQELGADHVFAKKVQVSYASHSTQVELIGPQLRQQLADLQSRPTALPLYSTVSGKQLGPEPLGAAYWYQNLRQPVRFHEAVEQLLTDGYRFFVEVSPHPVLAVALHSTLEENKHDAAVVGTLRRSQGHLGTLLRAVAELHCRGLAVDFGPSLPAGLPVPLPTYPFQRQRYWLPEAVARGKDVTAAGLSWVQHPLLGACTELADTQGHLFTARLKLGEQPWLADHRVYDTVLFPGTGFVELALAAGRELGMTTLSELTLVAPLGLSDPAGVRVQLRVEGATAQGHRALSIYSRAEAADPGDWTCHASGSLAPTDRAEPPQELGPWPPPGAQLVPLGDLYQRLAAMGLGYGPTFQGLRQLWTRGQELYARVALPADCAAQAGAFGLHPALLDAAVQSAALQPQSLQHGVQMPFEFRDVRLWAQGATELLVRLTPAGEGGSLGLQLFDVQGHRVAQIGELRVRPARAEQVQAAGTPTPAHLYQVQWQPVPAAPRDAPAVRAVVLGSGGLAERLGMPRWTDLQRGLESMGPGEAGPAQVLVDATAEPVQELLPAVHQGAHRALALLQAWGLQQRLRHSELVWVTQGAIAASVDEGVSGLDQAALWGLVRSARSEQPDRGLRLLDVEASSPGEQIRAALQVPDEPELALRQGGIWAPRLTAVHSHAEALRAPAGAQAFRLAVQTHGRLDGLQLVAADEALDTLGPGQVRVAVRATGVNFRDVLETLGMYPGFSEPLGFEGAGVVLEAGEGVSELRPGDRVMGFLRAAAATCAIGDSRLLVPIPGPLSFVQAATIPVAFLTALYGLFDLGQLRAGQRVLVHAATGGVGMAAVQLAQHAGAQVFTTAHPAKWGTLRQMGLDAAHISSSRSLDFESEFRASAQPGLDVVLNCLAGEYTDASLRLVRTGGRFVEMGKTDRRDPKQVAAQHPEVHYRAFDLMDAGPERIGQMLRQVRLLLEEGALKPLPHSAYDLRQGSAALRWMANGRHTGKLVLTPPRSLRADATVLVTGGTGELGSLVARYLVHHGARHLLLTSRRGLQAPGASALVVELEALGAHVSVASCDVSSLPEVAALLQGIPQDRPLRAVFHCAAELQDATLQTQSAQHLDRALGAKTDAALHLHLLTSQMDLDFFVLFSSLAGVMGSAGQANYAAANTLVDALAAHRRKLGLAGQSLAWGFWEPGGKGLTGQLSPADRERIRAQGIGALSAKQGLQLLEAALGRPEAMLVPARLEVAKMAAAQSEVPALLRALVTRVELRTVGSAPVLAGLRERLGRLPQDERQATVLELVRQEIAAVLRLSAGAAIPETQPLKNLGLDSLMAVELRNRLAARAQTSLPATLAFDYPTPQAIARFLSTKILPKELEPAIHDPGEEREVRRLLATLPLAALRHSGLLNRLLQLADAIPRTDASPPDEGSLSGLSNEDLVDLIKEL